MTLIATAIFVAGILGLFFLDWDRTARTGPGLWIPTIWLAICSSRMVSAWLPGGEGVSGSASDAYLEGSPTDRNILTGLLVIGLCVLVARRKQVLPLLRNNWPILVFYGYCLISIVWSEFPDVAFKRWTKFLADLIIVLIVVTEVNRTAAIKRLLARTAFVLIPLSVLLVKYYPDLGRLYGRFEGGLFFTGVATDKNMLGKTCMIFGLATVWRLQMILKSEDGRRKTKRLIAHGVVLAMTLWLLFNANSMTSISAFGLGSILMVATGFPAITKRRKVVHFMTLGAIALAFSALFLNLGSGLVSSLGRDPTLTGRTELWQQVFRLDKSPVLGTGFESFWLGPRLERLWSIYWWHPNQAHNGYIEVYLNLGVVGTAVLGLMIVSGYRSVMRGLTEEPLTGRLKLAFFVAAVAANFTEANFKMMSPIWTIFLLATLSIPQIRKVRKVREEDARAFPQETAALQEVV